MQIEYKIAIAKYKYNNLAKARVSILFYFILFYFAENHQLRFLIHCNVIILDKDIPPRGVNKSANKIHWAAIVGAEFKKCILSSQTQANANKRNREDTPEGSSKAVDVIAEVAVPFPMYCTSAVLATVWERGKLHVTSFAQTDAGLCLHDSPFC